MGYSTFYEGQIEITPPLNKDEMDYLSKFRETRRMHREKGPYFVDGSGFMGQGNDDDILDFNSPDPSQPGLWCKWEITEDGRFIEWDGGEKFYGDIQWMRYLIDHFLKPDALAKEALPFLQCNHVMNGTIYSQGEEIDDTWAIHVENNMVEGRKIAITPIGQPMALNQNTVVDSSFNIDMSMAIDAKLKISGITAEQIHCLDEDYSYQEIPVPEVLREKFGGLQHLMASISSDGENLSIYLNYDYLIPESVFLIFELLFNPDSELYDHDLDMKNCSVDGIIEIKNTYYNSSVTDGLAAIAVLNNKLFLHDGKMVVIDDKNNRR